MSEMKVIACIIARTNSTRLRRKVLKRIGDRMMIEHLIERTKLSKQVDQIYVCTSRHPDDAVLLDIARDHGVQAYAGSELSVIDRLLDVAELEQAHSLVRVLGDNPLTDPFTLDQVIDSHRRTGADFSVMEFLPRGAGGGGVIKVEALARLHAMMDPNESQYLTVYINDPENFTCNYLTPSQDMNRPFVTFSVDRAPEFEDVSALIDVLGIDRPLTEYIALAEAEGRCRMSPEHPVKISEQKTITYAEYVEWKADCVKYTVNRDPAARAHIHLPLPGSDRGAVP